MMFEYKILRADDDGRCTVEYVSKEYGSFMVSMVLPLDREEPVVHRAIVEKFPIDEFHSRKLARVRGGKLNFLRGSFEFDFDDHFYSVQEGTTVKL